MLSETDQIVSYFETVHDKQKGINILMNFITCTSTQHYCCCWPTSLFSYFLVLILKLETTILTCGPKNTRKERIQERSLFVFNASSGDWQVVFIVLLTTSRSAILGSPRLRRALSSNKSPFRYAFWNKCQLLMGTWLILWSLCTCTCK